MKYFIYLCCIALLLTEISARLRLTTSLPSALRSNDDVAREASKIDEIIDFVNSVYVDDGRSIARSGRYDSMLRRYELPVVQGINIAPSVLAPNDEDTENQLEKQEDVVRYHVIDNPEVLEEYSNKQKQKNISRLLKPVPVTSDTSDEAKSFSTVENKLRYYHFKAISNASHNSNDSNKLDQLHGTPHQNPLDNPQSNINPLDGVQEPTTVASIYRPSFPDNEDNEEKLVTEDIEVTVTEKDINTPIVDARKHGGSTAKHPEINNTVEIENRTLDNKASDKEYQARFEEKKAHADNTKETGQIKYEFPLKTDKNNDRVTVNEEKDEISTKIDHNTNESLSENNVRPINEDNKNDESKQINGTTDTKSGEDSKLKERSWDTNIITYLPAEILMGKIDKSALRTQKKNDYRNHKEQHSTYLHKERNENGNKQFKNRHEKRHKHDRKKKDKNGDGGWSKNEKYWNKNDKQRYNKNNGYDRMEYEWKKRHQQYDEQDNLNVNDNQWGKNDDFSSRDRDSNKRENDWDKRDNDWKKRENYWNERDIDTKKRNSDSNKRDIDSNKRDNDWNKRDSAWNKRDSEWIRQERKTYEDDRNKDDWDREKNEWENKDLDISTKNGGITHDRFKIVERKGKDGDYGRHSEV